jgi:hypothetical protein
VLAGAGQMDRLIAMQMKKRRGGRQFQMQSSKYISFDVPTNVLMSDSQASSGYQTQIYPNMHIWEG